MAKKNKQAVASQQKQELKKKERVNISDFIKKYDDELKTADTNERIVSDKERFSDENVKSALQSTKFNESEKQEIVTQNLDIRIKDRIDGLRDVTKTKPLFTKPVYFLQTATPYIKAQLVIVGGKQDSLTYIFLPPSTTNLENENKGSYNNIIKNFEYSTQDHKVKLVITDADQDIIEYIGYILGNMLMSVAPVLEIEYGWYHKDSSIDLQNFMDLSDYQGDRASVIETRCYFRRSLFCVVTDFEHTYSNEGVLELTFIGMKEMNFPEPFQHFLPYDFVGKNPGVTLQMIHTLYSFYIFFGEELQNKKTSESIKKKNIGEFIIKFLYFFKQIKSTDGIIHVLLSSFAFFTNDTLIIQSDSNEFEYFVNFLNNLGKDEKQSKNVKNKKFVNMFVNNQIDIKKYKIDSTFKNLQEIFNLFQKSNSLISIQDNLRTLLSDNTEVSKSLRKLVMDLTPVLNNSLIHPWDILQFMKQTFKEQLKTIKEKSKNDSSLSDDKKRDIDKTHVSYIQGFNDGYIGGYKNPNDNVDVYNFGNENYLIKASDINLNPSSSWSQVFKMVSEKCFVWIGEQDWQQIKDGDTSPQSNKESIEKEKIAIGSKEVKNQVPTKIIGNCFEMSKEEATQNIYTLLQIVEARQQFQQSLNVKPNILQDIVTTSNAIDDIKKEYKIISDLPKGTPVLLLSFEVIPGVDSLYNPLNGKQQILQAYSFRMANKRAVAFTNTESNDFSQYNPGYPSVWDIDFPDILSFQPKLNFRDQVANVGAVMKESIPALQQKIEAKTLEISILEKENPTGNNSEEKKKENKKKIEEAKQELASIRRQKEYFSQYHGKVPYTNPSLLIFKNPLVENSSFADIQGRRKVMQEFRKHSLLASTNITADLDVIGDPIYDVNALGKYIFIKYYTKDGDLSYFTGIYVIQNIKHAISNGQYITSLSLLKDSTAGSSELAGQLYNAVTQSDNGEA